MCGERCDYTEFLSPNHMQRSLQILHPAIPFGMVNMVGLASVSTPVRTHSSSRGQHGLVLRTLNTAAPHAVLIPSC